VLDGFLVRKVTFADDYAATMEQKQIALENVTTERHKAEAAEYQKQQKIRDAEANAQATKLAADAEAYSITVRGESLANNPDIIKWEFVHNLATAKWLMIPSDGLIPMLNLGE
jgi:regulator of protease activity HflC (stomatin/prohibitin superfamily)